MSRNYKLFALLFIFLLAFGLRFYRLDAVPNGYREDETSLGYNAYSILKTGLDEHGSYLPQNFKAFGEYKLPGYIYSSVIPVGIFGLNPWGIRFVSAFSGFLTVIAAYFLAKELIIFLKKDDKVPSRVIGLTPHLTAFLLAINPWLLHFSRSAFEVTLANFLALSGALFFLLNIRLQKMVYGMLAVIFFSGAIYTYNIGRLFVPLFVIFLLFIFKKKILNQKKYHIIVYTSTLLVCSLPFIIGAISRGGFDSTLGTLIFSSAKVQAPLQEFRSYFVEWPILNKIFLNYWILTAWLYITNVFAHLSPSFFFIFGPEEGSTSFAKMGQWYLFELPLVIAGFIFLMKKRTTSALIVVSWIASLVLISSLTREPPQATRTFFLLFPISFSSAIGLSLLLNKLSQINKYKKYIGYGLVSLVIAYSILIYLISYYVRFPVYYARYWRTADKQVSEFIRDHNEEYDIFIIDSGSGFNYTSLLVYLQYPPERFIKEARWNPEDSEGFTFPTEFGKYQIRKVDWQTDLEIPNALIITSSKDRLPDVGILKTITLPQRPVVINTGQTITRYPFSEPVFHLIETKNN